ncbi:hypothetical protein SVAN01_06185 [Stagonosporopsis vannaccii]|nr:hypothetical protein SVAN01_06185 [Stagonosporopsis vannaccii]
MDTPLSLPFAQIPSSRFFSSLSSAPGPRISLRLSNNTAHYSHRGSRRCSEEGVILRDMRVVGDTCDVRVDNSRGVVVGLMLFGTFVVMVVVVDVGESAASKRRMLREGGLLVKACKRETQVSHVWNVRDLQTTLEA